MAGSTPFAIGVAADAIDKSIQNIFQKMATPELQLKKYFNFRTTTDYFEKDSSYSGLQEAEFTVENASITEDVPIQGNDKTYTQEQVDIMESYTHIAWKFAIKKRDLTNIATQIQNALNTKKEKLCAERLTNGFDTTYSHAGVGGTRTITITGGDSLEAFTTAHTREDGGTNMNNVVYDGTTYSLPFDYAGYKAAIRTASLFVDPRGNPFPADLNLLVCKKGSSVAFKAKEILGSIKKGMISESNDNDGSGTPPFQILELDFLENDAYWFMTDKSRMNDTYGFQFVEGESNNIDSVNIVYKTRELQFAGHTVFDMGHNDTARSWVASAGDSATT